MINRHRAFRRPTVLTAAYAAVLMATMTGPSAAAESAGADAAVRRQYTFAWQFLPDDAMAPRGGSTRGTGVTLRQAPSPAWRALAEPEIDTKTRDRRAILAMAGPYRVSFDFIETVGFTTGYEPSAPYQSWGTEHVYVVADEPDFISLQHVLVMRMTPETDTGEPDTGEDKVDRSDAVVVKHWRQDWHYEGRSLTTYQGHDTWATQRLPRSAASGRWLQAVYQVDDSPRYQALGTWRHFDNYSSWESDETWRPLPRREFSVRDDYDVLVGTNRHTIYPTGWVQEEDNLKMVLDDDAGIAEGTSVLAREAGLARYERIEGFDWAPGDEYWARTAPFWALVREAWQDAIADRRRFTVAENADGRPLFAAMFELAWRTTTAETFDPEQTRREVRTTLASYLDGTAAAD